jgi:hypothetical protein
MAWCQYLMSRVDEPRQAPSSIFEDHHRDWTFYNGDGARGGDDAVPRQHGGPSGRRRRQVPMQVDMEYRRAPGSSKNWNLKRDLSSKAVHL